MIRCVQNIKNQQGVYHGFIFLGIAVAALPTRKNAFKCVEKIYVLSLGRIPIFY